jgi:hypothetical protein
MEVVMSGFVRIVLAVLLLLCSLGIRTYAQHPEERESPEKKAAESEIVHREKVIDDMMRKEGISREEAEQRIKKVQDGFAPKQRIEEKHPGAVRVPFEEKVQTNRTDKKIELEDAPPAHHPGDARKSLLAPHNTAGTDGSVPKSSADGSSSRRPESKAGAADHGEAPEKRNREESAGESEQHEHHADRGCAELPSQAARDKCEEDKKSGKRELVTALLLPIPRFFPA